jgi:cytochrome b6-f complex iron-sulfur subunit
MSDVVERLHDFVEALLKDRRPKRYPTDPEEAAAMHAATSLRTARPGADLPSPEFVAGLERRLAREVTRPEEPAQPAISRRRALQAAGLTAAAAVVAGVAAGRLAPGAPDTTTADGTSDDALNPRNAQWVAVAAASAVGPGKAMRFSAGAVEGFVVNQAGRVNALSAVCTHMGCILKVNQDAGSLDCPCHGASFHLDGSPLNREYLRSLPTLESRVREGMVEVKVSSSP